MSVNMVRQDLCRKTGVALKKTGSLALDQALEDLKLRGEHRQFAVLDRDANTPPVATYCPIALLKYGVRMTIWACRVARLLPML